jgi:hypothetical protein
MRSGARRISACWDEGGVEGRGIRRRGSGWDIMWGRGLEGLGLGAAESFFSFLGF